MKKRLFFDLLSFFTVMLEIAFMLVYSAQVNSEEQAPKRPNIVVIYTDDVGYGDLSCYGGKIPTPNIDSLASKGLLFTNAHATSASCTPSRFALMTGTYPWRRADTKIAPGNAGSIISPNQMTLPRILQQAGYQTAAIGKWHLGLGPSETGPDWNGVISPGPRQLGFTESFIIPATVDRVPCVFVENERVYRLDPNDPIEVDYNKKIGTWPTGKENPELLTMHTTHGHDNTIVNGIGRIGFMTGGKSALWTDTDISDVLTARGVDFIKRNKETPFFLYFSTHDIHVPRSPHSRFAGKSGRGARGDVILQMDDAVGTIIRTLEEIGIRDNTLILFSSDNGPIINDGYFDGSMENLGDHLATGPLRGAKYSAFEAGTRVPFIVSWPAEVKPGQVDALFSQVDLLASFAALTDQVVPVGEAKDSENHLPTFLGKSKEGRDFLIEQSVFGLLSCLSKEWKYIEPRQKGIAKMDGPRMGNNEPVETGNFPEPQLYNLHGDIGETTNVASEYPQVVKEMAERLAKARK
ncbi:MAG: sulfatase family protein [Thermoguttaceae bacterium]